MVIHCEKKILPGYHFILATLFWQLMATYLVCVGYKTRQKEFWWHWHIHWRNYLLLRHKLSILRELQAFTGNPLCYTVCMNCFKNCTYCFENVKDDLRDVPRLLRKTVKKMDSLVCCWTIPSKYQSNQVNFP